MKLTDYTDEVEGALDLSTKTFLEEACAELESQVKRNTKVNTGKTKASWQHKVTKKAGEDIGYVGTSYQNAIWEEFGTGEYALEGDGRKGGWTYQDAEGNWHKTDGKKPRRAFWNAYKTVRSKIEKAAQAIYKRGLK